MFFPIKFFIWYFGLRFADSGSARRPWILGVLIGILFGVFDLITDHLSLTEALTLFGANIIAACLFLNVRCRIDGIVSTVLLTVIGTAVMCFGIPALMVWMFENPGEVE